MKIVFYNETIMSGGIEKCIELLNEYLHKDNEIEIVYIDETKLDLNVVNVLKKNAKVYKIERDTKIKADLCIWCRLYMNYDILQKQILAKRNVLWVHSEPRILGNCILDNEEFLKNLDDIICVSKTIQKQLLVNKDSQVIHNFLPINIKELSNINVDDNFINDSKRLKLVTVSRLSNGKGFNRVFKLVELLKYKNVSFEFIVVGKGRAKEQEIKELFKGIEEVKFIGYKENPYPYIRKADYLVQLSDYETWGNVITEAKQLGTPVIATNFSSIYEQIENDINGVIIDLNENDYNKYIERILDKKEVYKDNLKSFSYHNEIEKWNRVINKRKQK